MTRHEALLKLSTKELAAFLAEAPERLDEVIILDACRTSETKSTFVSNAEAFEIWLKKEIAADAPLSWL